MFNLHRKKVGLALGSGGWRGGVHIGVIRVLEKYGIPIDYIAGTSAGSIVGGIYAYKKDITLVETMFREVNMSVFAKSYMDISMRGGLIKGNQFIKVIAEHTDNSNIEDTIIPFCAVATDLFSGEKVEMKEGNLAEALKTSSTIPLIFKPTITNGRYLVDGGLTSPIPVQTVKDMGADIVIAVDTLGGVFPIDTSDIKEVSSNKLVNISMRLLLESLSRRDKSQADIVIDPKIPGAEVGLLHSKKSQAITIQCGVDATEELIHEIKRLID